MSDKLNLVFKAKRPTDAVIISQALGWLRRGLLASALPKNLMDEFNLSAEKAGELAGAAVTQWKKETKPLNSESNEGQ